MPGARDGTFLYKMRGYNSSGEEFEVRAYLPNDVQAYCEDMKAAGCRATASNDRKGTKDKKTYTMRIMRDSEELAAVPCEDSMASLQQTLADMLRTEPWLQKPPVRLAPPPILDKTPILDKVASYGTVMKVMLPAIAEATFMAKFKFKHRSGNTTLADDAVLPGSVHPYYTDMHDLGFELHWNLYGTGIGWGVASIVRVDKPDDPLCSSKVPDSYDSLQDAFVKLLLEEPWIKVAANV